MQSSRRRPRHTQLGDCGWMPREMHRTQVHSSAARAACTRNEQCIQRAHDIDTRDGICRRDVAVRTTTHTRHAPHLRITRSARSDTRLRLISVLYTVKPTPLGASPCPMDALWGAVQRPSSVPMRHLPNQNSPGNLFPTIPYERPVSHEHKGPLCVPGFCWWSHGRSGTVPEGPAGVLQVPEQGLPAADILRGGESARRPSADTCA